MGCDKCDEYHAAPHGIYYYRWGKANVSIGGCEEHIKEVMEALNKVQKEKR